MSEETIKKASTGDASVTPIDPVTQAAPANSAYIAPNIPAPLLKAYDPKATEETVYKLEEASGLFHPETAVAEGITAKDAKSYTIIMPPPNANGRLHVGHSLTITLQDIFTRYHRMKGEKALYVPGADHAGFETQIVYERKLEKEGRSRFNMNPEELYKEIYAFTIENKKFMEDDVRRIGASCDWSREKFTLDPDVVTSAQETFRKMFRDDLVYRGKRIVNWCAKHQTSLSDVETEFIEKKDPFYYFKYGPFEIATARPETKFGDKYVVMHPEDTRYAAYEHGQKIELEWINGPITATIIKDSAIDMEFGTGVMTITPWHDPVDFEIAQRHNLDFEQIIDFKGKLLPIAQEFAGIHISKARPQIVEKLKAKGLLVRVDENYTHNVKCCYKCETQIEPQIKDQWFVKMKPLAEKALEAVKSGSVRFLPENYEKIFTYWMENTLDWNISRQIVWGIPIPAKVCVACNQGFLDTDIADTCPTCNQPLTKDTDTFDTWFSSGQWPLLALGYSHGTRKNTYRDGSESAEIDGDVATYHPTQVMETGRDLIFKWIPRMVIFSLYLKQQIPFELVYLNGLVNDSKGQKMSKSKGNVTSPIDLIEKYGSDALRMWLAIGNTPGNDLSMAEDKIKGYKHFGNKLWNITRFILSSTEPLSISYDQNFSSWSEADQKLIAERNELWTAITREFNEYKIHLAAEKLYHYAWSTLADVILEDSKVIFNGRVAKIDESNPEKNTEAAEPGTDADKQSRAQFLLHTLRMIITSLHPIMPHITEELWSILNTGKSILERDHATIKPADLLMAREWPLFSHNQ